MILTWCCSDSEVGEILILFLVKDIGVQVSLGLILFYLKKEKKKKNLRKILCSHEGSSELCCVFSQCVFSLHLRAHGAPRPVLAVTSYGTPYLGVQRMNKTLRSLLPVLLH